MEAQGGSAFHNSAGSALSGHAGLNSAHSRPHDSHSSGGHSSRAVRSQISAAVSYEVRAAGSAAFSSRSLEGESALSAVEHNVEECSRQHPTLSHNLAPRPSQRPKISSAPCKTPTSHPPRPTLPPQNQRRHNNNTTNTNNTNTNNSVAQNQQTPLHPRRPQRSAPSNMAVEMEISGDRGGGHTISQALQGENDNVVPDGEVEMPQTPGGGQGNVFVAPANSSVKTGASLMQQNAVQSQVHSAGGGPASSAGMLARTSSPYSASLQNDSFRRPSVQGGAGVSQNQSRVEPPPVHSQPAGLVVSGPLFPAESAPGAVDGTLPIVSEPLLNPLRCILTSSPSPHCLPAAVSVVDIGPQPTIQQIHAAIQSAYASLVMEGAGQVASRNTGDVNPANSGFAAPPVPGPRALADHSHAGGGGQSQAGDEVKQEGSQVEASPDSCVDAVHQEASVHGTLLADDAVSDAETNLSYLQERNSRQQCLGRRRRAAPVQSAPNRQSKISNHQHPANTTLTGADSVGISRGVGAASTVARHSYQSGNNTSGGGTVNMSSNEEDNEDVEVKDTAYSGSSSRSQSGGESNISGGKSVTKNPGEAQIPCLSGSIVNGPARSSKKTDTMGPLTDNHTIENQATDAKTEQETNPGNNEQAVTTSTGNCGREELRDGGSQSPNTRGRKRRLSVSSCPSRRTRTA